MADIVYTLEGDVYLNITNTIKVTDVSDGNDGIAFEKTIGELISYE